MVPAARRQFLALCAGVLATTGAGCVDDETSPGPDDDPVGPDEEDVITDVATHVSRLDVDLGTHESVLSYEEAPDEQVWERRLPYVIDDDDADALVVDPRPENIEGVRAFLQDTDYDEETVLAFDFDVSACHRSAVMYVERRSSDRLTPQFCRTTRDPMIECSTDSRHRQLTLIRVPEAYDRPPSGHGRGESANCRLPPGHPDRNEGERR